jgi:hypothetical protein
MDNMNQKIAFSNLVFFSTLLLFSGCIQPIEHCPPSYGISVTILEGSTNTYKNITRSDITAVPTVADLLDKVVENSSLSQESIFFDQNEWNHTVKYLESLFQTKDVVQYDQWIVFYRNEFLRIDTFVIVC